MKSENLKMGGQSLVELLVAVGVAAIFLPALATGLVATRNGRAQEVQRLKAAAILRETEEAVRVVRGSDWTTFANLSGTGAQHPQISSSTWTLVSGVGATSGFTRQVVISDVYRDSSGKIVSSGGTSDPSFKKVVSSVSWANPLPSTVISTMYLARLGNVSYTETTQTDFNKGAVTNVKVQATSGSSVPDDGEIVLSQTGGFGDWCNPAPTPITQVDLSGQGVPNAVSATQGDGDVFVAAAEGGNASGVTLVNIDASDPSYPTAPIATVAGTVSNSPVIKTNGVFNEVGYGYLAADQHGKASQGIIVNLSNYTGVGSLDLGTNANGKSIYVLNNIAYLTADDGYLYAFNVQNRNGSHSPISGSKIQLAGVGNKIIVVGTNAYIATSSITTQFQIVDVSPLSNTPPGAPSITASISVGNGKGATDVYVNQTQLRAYLVTSYASLTQPDFFTIDVNPADGSWYKQVVNTFNTCKVNNNCNDSSGNMSPTGVVAVSGSRAIIVGTGSSKNYQVIALSSEAYPNPPALSTCGSGGLATTYNINGVATWFTNNAKRVYSYIITDDSRKELKIIEGGPGAGNGNFVPSGTFISGPFGPLTLPTAFNSFSADIAQPQANEVQLLFAVADPVGNSCSASSGVNYTFVGVNGTATPFESSVHPGSAVISGAIPFGNFPPSYKNPDKCFEYKVSLFTSDSTLTPVFKDITINYSP